MIEAWLLTRLKALGPIAAAVGVVVGMLIVICLLIGGLWWLRIDAARDARATERHQCEIDRETASREAAEAQAAIDRETASAANEARQQWLAELAAARSRAADLELMLQARQSRVVCYPKDLARELNR
jgi:FtsZ-interacting cell division protein ZipA